MHPVLGYAKTKSKHSEASSISKGATASDMTLAVAPCGRTTISETRCGTSGSYSSAQRRFRPNQVRQPSN